ncbi:hypothetical protein PYCC9005_001669 [Savitreella phatthalungensis]
MNEPDSPGTEDLQKRKRLKYVSKACAECKRRKIRCDGSQPCSHCVGVGVECLYLAGKARGGARRPGHRPGDATSTAGGNGDGDGDGPGSGDPSAADASMMTELIGSDIDEDYGTRLSSLEHTVDLILHHYPLPSTSQTPAGLATHALSGIKRAASASVSLGSPQDRLPKLHLSKGPTSAAATAAMGGPASAPAVSSHSLANGQSPKSSARKSISIRSGPASDAFYGASASNSELFKLRTRLCSTLPASSRTEAELIHCERPASPTGAQKMADISISNPQDLPPRGETYAILATLFDDLMSMYPMIHGPSFVDLYAPLWDAQGDYLPDVQERYAPSEMGLLYATLAAAMILMEQQGLDQCPIQAHKYYLSAKLLIVDKYLDRPADLESVQALCLLSLYFLHIEDEDASYKMTGMAIRAAFEIGLHLRTRETGQTPLVVETRRRTWWCLYLLDRRTSISLGRPIGIRDSDSDVDFPTPLDDLLRFPQQLDAEIRLEQSKIPYLMSYVHFAAICGTIYDKVYGVRAQFPPDERTVTDLDSQLEQWRYALPAFLRFSQDKLGRAPKWLSKQQLFLHLRGCHVRLLLIRPFVTEPPKTEVSQDSFQFRMAELSLRLCSEMIHTISLVKRTSDLVDQLWYPAKQYLLAAVGVIFSVVLNFQSKMHPQFSAQACKADLRVALQILKDFSTKSEGSRRNLRDVQFLRYMCNQALRSRRQQQREQQQQQHHHGLSIDYGVSPSEVAAMGNGHSNSNSNGNHPMQVHHDNQGGVNSSSPNLPGGSGLGPNGGADAMLAAPRSHAHGGGGAGERQASSSSHMHQLGGGTGHSHGHVDDRSPQPSGLLDGTAHNAGITNQDGSHNNQGTLTGTPFPTGLDESDLLMSLLDTGDKGMLPTAEQYMGFGTYASADGQYISEPLFVGL